MKGSRITVRVTALLTMLCVAAVLLTGCSLTKKAISSDDFFSLAVEKGLQCKTVSDQSSDLDPSIQLTLAVSENPSYQVEFYTFPEESQAKSFFAKCQNYFETTKDSNYAASSFSGMNYGSYKLTSGNHYSVIEYVGNTAVYVNCDKSNKDAVDDLLSAMGY